MKEEKAMPRLLFESSWEVCNKVGGIYAVLSTKAKTIQGKAKDSVIFIGPDIWDSENKSPFFKETKTILSEWQKSCELPNGVKARVGRWDVPGQPLAILVDYKPLLANKNEIYGKMWEEYKVDSLNAYGDYDDSCMFACAAALVIESVVSWNKIKADEVIAHFDEWQTGMGLLYLKMLKPSVATVFTTHATSIGRSICGNGKPLYDYMEGYNGDQMAQELNMVSKHSVEKTAAHQAGAFTTVSDVTARECEQLLEIKPLVTPNAFEQNYVPKGKKYDEARAAARTALLNVAASLTGEKFAEDTLILATSGRNEFRNKGLDAFVDSINVLRETLRGKKRKVVAFVMVPAWVDTYREDLQKSLSKKRKNRLDNAIITHTIHNYDSDSIYSKAKWLGFDNSAKDNVKLIYVPSYLTGNDGIFNLSYYDLLAGVDATIFASYYEPWGYTPLESVAFGAPTITTDLAGFGQWALSLFGEESANNGVTVIKRTDSNYSEAVAAIVESVKKLYEMSAKDMETLRQAAKKTSKIASWENFMKYYEVAYDQAIKNTKEL